MNIHDLNFFETGLAMYRAENIGRTSIAKMLLNQMLAGRRFARYAILHTLQGRHFGGCFLSHFVTTGSWEYHRFASRLSPPEDFA
jgi:hypothetical protein